MRKVAIVGVEGSGKTVMLAGLGELYSHPDENGYFLGPKNFATASYVTDKIQRMRRGEWPTATAGDEMQGLDWILRKKASGQRPIDVCEVSFLDFAGEVYRTAFGVRKNDGDAELAKEAESLRRYIREANELIVLINLRDVIYSLVVTSNSPVAKINWIDEGARNLVNVAVTRARQTLYVVGNKEYVRTHSSPSKPLGALLYYIEGLSS